MGILVIGAGLSGLTTATTLARQGYDVTVIAEKVGVDSASVIATAIWHVYLVDPDDKRILDWSSRTLEVLLHLAATDTKSGVELIEGVELFRNSEEALPTWFDIPPKFSMLTLEELQDYPGVKWGYFVSAPVANMEKYLPWLVDEAKKSGVTFQSKKLASLEDVDPIYDLVVSCTGIESQSFLADKTVVPVRGQYLMLRNAGIELERYIGDDDHPEGMSYAILRDGDLLVGGTEEFGVAKLEFDQTPDAILSRAAKFAPEISQIDPRKWEKVVGLRPFRPGGVCLEMTSRMTKGGSMPVIFNYGHGGSGFSLSWGCAEEVLHLVQSFETSTMPLR
jgi:D-amino-acid oxidase